MHNFNKSGNDQLGQSEPLWEKTSPFSWPKLVHGRAFSVLPLLPRSTSISIHISSPLVPYFCSFKSFKSLPFPFFFYFLFFSSFSELYFLLTSFLFFRSYRTMVSALTDTVYHRASNNCSCLVTICLPYL